MSVKTFSDIKLPVTATERELLAIAKKKLGAEPKYFAIRKKSLDARDKSNLPPANYQSRILQYPQECYNVPLLIGS